MKQDKRFNPSVWQAQIIVTGLCLIVIALEYLTPSEYVFGYLYSGIILLVHSRLKRITAYQVTLLAVFLTLLNLWVPEVHLSAVPTLANRLIATLALIVTAWLSDRNRRYEEAIARQQAQLQAQAQLASIRENFVSTLTHDLKTPLLGAIETLKSFEKGQFGDITPIQQRVLGMMQKSHSSSVQLVETLLDVYRNDTEGLHLNLSAVNLATLADEAIATLTELGRSRNVYIVLNYGASDFRQHFWTKGDSLQLQRVFANLIANAINHAPRGSKVEIILESDGSTHVVKVGDRGPGMSADEIPLLFERFYQGHSDRQAKGSGLGLYLTRQIVQAHEGIIWAENRQPTGALFAFRLPAISPLLSSV
ncbi:HAMP domain-containing sensor histidine kinase [Kamptonema cortianum]|uniref:histidine kinase n=1 Tax=Geitlerinema calcuttense NRMC-F 0142 TaxID=2922238 RepID=A0ABT7LVU1_9CYAN|nr:MULTISPECIES: HAMP domain-containing sensor histidine kinase [Cyanophyceae]MCD8489829.1 HAMP domain-containing histidine kinase [Desertifilum sp.]MDK3158123.1 HAMP domain-containing sensor histidine kinase [Kamptonema cortianum]MDL5052668.1 HAMP domain-containing sensor histidine kinase [Oscillatoria laete-virens NRMC-F 0139]MDL5056158.1 HAMP domain-containing sensor histidine kinase [Geitlerinema calcuttense NRMC-F 0142]